jgi:hypothetical protein
MARFEVAKTAAAVAQMALKQAEHRAETARHDDVAADLVQAVEDADLELRRARTAAIVGAAQVASSRENHVRTVHASLETDHTTAVAARLAACQKADAARALADEAMGEFHAANGMLNATFAKGRIRSFDGSFLSTRIGEAQQEVPSAADHSALFEGTL